MAETETIRKLDELVKANRQILQELHELSFNLVGLVTAHAKLIQESSCILTEKSIQKALDDFENRNLPMSQRRRT